MQEHIKLEVALELISSKIAEKMNEIETNKIEFNKKQLENELQLLLEEKEKAYQGDKKIIEKILTKGVKN